MPNPPTGNPLSDGERKPRLSKREREQREQERRDWLNVALAKLQGDRVLWILADALMRDWCSKLGGPPTDSGELVALRCSFDIAAEEELAFLMTIPEGDRRVLARKLDSRRIPPGHLMHSLLTTAGDEG